MSARDVEREMAWLRIRIAMLAATATARTLKIVLDNALRQAGGKR